MLVDTDGIHSCIRRAALSLHKAEESEDGIFFVGCWIRSLLIRLRRLRPYRGKGDRRLFSLIKGRTLVWFGIRVGSMFIYTISVVGALLIFLPTAERCRIW